MTSDFDELIAASRRAQLARLEAAQAVLMAIRDARGDATADDEHDPEGATLASEWSRAEGQRAEAARELDRLDAAVHRLADGTYGICVSCGRPIPEGRLRLMPAATQCVPCAETAR